MNIVLAICPQVNPDKPPLSLAYLVSYLAKKNIDVSCLDFNIDLYSKVSAENKQLWEGQSERVWKDKGQYESLNLVTEEVLEGWAQEIRRLSPDIVGFSLLVTNVYSTLRLAKKLKEGNKDLKIVCGGPEVCRIYGLGGHNSLLEYADILVIGEGEKNLERIARFFGSNKEIIPAGGVLIKKNGIFIGNGNTDLIGDINQIPFPDYDYLFLYKYKERGQLPLIFSRGCIGNCAFCFERPYWKQYRCRSADNVIWEAREMSKRHNIRHFSLNDSLINGNMAFLSEFCDKVTAQNLDIKWWGMARVNNQMTKEFLAKMVKAGCQQIAYGIESGSQRVLDLMRKGVEVPTIDEVLLNTYLSGIKPGINLMVGFPGEEEEDFQETCDFVKRNAEYIFYVNISSLGIEPSTGVYKDMEKLGIDYKDSGDWQLREGVNTSQIRSERIEKLSEVVSQYIGKANSFLKNSSQI